jgi:uncharacterized protein (TIGR03083 family)
MASIHTDLLIKTVMNEATRLGDYLAGLDASAWSRDSACDGWVIGDVVAHLAGGAATWANSINRAVAGDSDPPEGQEFMAPGDRGSETIGQAARSSHQQFGMQLMENFRTGYAGLAQVLSGLKADDWDKPCFHRRGPMPIQDFVSLRLQELAIHGWDIRSGLDQTANVSEEALPVLTGRVPRWLNNAFTPGLRLPAPVRYRFDISSPVPVQEDILVTRDSFSIQPISRGPADVTFRCNTGNYILLIYGRLSPQKGVANGRLTIEGSQAEADNFAAWFKGF